MKNLKGFLLVFVALLFASGCQPTPESETVIQTGDFLKNLQEVSFAPYEAPERVEDSKTESGLTIVFDAEVIVPEASAYSIVELEQVQYSQEEIAALMDLFAPDANWINGMEQTKSASIREISEGKTGWRQWCPQQRSGRSRSASV